MTDREQRGLAARETVSRRDFLKRSGGGVSLAIVGGAVLSPEQGWGLQPESLSAEQMATLIQMARDIYPHDRLADRFYAVAVKPFDRDAAENAELKATLDAGLADLDARAGDGGYRRLGWEIDRVAVLREIEDTAFFQTIRGGLVVNLYNQSELWPLFGYEGASSAQGGYIERGFDDIDWV